MVKKAASSKKSSVKKSEATDVQMKDDTRSKTPKNAPKLSTKRKKARRDHERAGLILPSSRFRSQMTKILRGMRVSKKTNIFMAATMQYIVGEILDLSYDLSRMRKRTRISEKDLIDTIRSDSELERLIKPDSLVKGIPDPPFIHHKMINRSLTNGIRPIGSTRKIWREIAQNGQLVPTEEEREMDEEDDVSDEESDNARDSDGESDGKGIKVRILPSEDTAKDRVKRNKNRQMTLQEYQEQKRQRKAQKRAEKQQKKNDDDGKVESDAEGGDDDGEDEKDQKKGKGKKVEGVKGKTGKKKSAPVKNKKEPEDHDEEKRSAPPSAKKQKGRKLGEGSGYDSAQESEDSKNVKLQKSKKDSPASKKSKKDKDEMSEGERVVDESNDNNIPKLSDWNGSYFAKKSSPKNGHNDMGMGMDMDMDADEQGGDGNPTDKKSGTKRKQEEVESFGDGRGDQEEEEEEVVDNKTPRSSLGSASGGDDEGDRQQASDSQGLGADTESGEGAKGTHLDRQDGDDNQDEHEDDDDYENGRKRTKVDISKTGDQVGSAGDAESVAIDSESMDVDNEVVFKGNSGQDEEEDENHQNPLSFVNDDSIQGKINSTKNLQDSEFKEEEQSDTPSVAPSTKGGKKKKGKSAPRKSKSTKSNNVPVTGGEGSSSKPEPQNEEEENEGATPSSGVQPSQDDKGINELLKGGSESARNRLRRKSVSNRG